MKKLFITLALALPACTFAQKLELSVSNPVNMIATDGGDIDGVTPNGVNARVLYNFKRYQLGVGADIINSSGGTVLIPQFIVNRVYRFKHGYFYDGLGIGYLLNEQFNSFEIGMQVGVNIQFCKYISFSTEIATRLGGTFDNVDGPVPVLIHQQIGMGLHFKL